MDGKTKDEAVAIFMHDIITALGGQIPPQKTEVHVRDMPEMTDILNHAEEMARKFTQKVER